MLGMSHDPPPQRRRPLHGIKLIDGQPTIIFETLCVKDRLPILANDEFHDAFRDVASAAAAWLLGRYVIMPDHIHFFAGYTGQDIPYENWVKYLKSQLTRALGGRGSRPGGRGSRPGGRGSRRAEKRVPGPGSAGASPSPAGLAELRWQSDHWDTRIRNPDAYEQKWLYVINNPLRKGLVAKPEDWPYQGELFPLRW
jgi:putative transposase